jgi:putative salt-induced outer membrane protein YdiY
MRGLIIFAWICFPGLLAADQLTLKNGDRVTGKIVKKDGDKIAVKSDLMGEVTIPWSSVTAIASDEPLSVVLQDGKTVTGKVATVEGKVQIAAASAPLPEVASIRNAVEQAAYERLQHPGWLELWAGTLDLGLAATRGNAKTETFTTALTAIRATRTDKTTVYFNQIYATATVNQKSAETAQAVRGGWAHNRNLGARLFVNVFNDYEFDRFQNLDLRFVGGGGLGYSTIKTERAKLDVLAGADYNREQFSTPLTRNSAEAFWGDDWSYKVSRATSFSQSFRMFNNLSDTGVYRVNIDMGAATAVRKWLSWQVTASDRLLSNPVPGRQKNDLILSTGFRVNFAR